MFETYYPRKRKAVHDLGLSLWFRDVLGTYFAARWLMKRGWSLEAALFNLLHIARRDH